MASTDTRSGFRLPWNSDRSHEQPTDEPQVEGDGSEIEASAAEGDVNWPRQGHYRPRGPPAPPPPWLTPGSRPGGGPRRCGT